MTLKDLLEEYQSLKRQREELTQQINLIKDRLNELEAEMLVKLDELGSDNATVRGLGTVIRKEEIVPTIEDWDALNTCVKENDMLYLFQRRLNAAAYRDLLDQGIEIKGVKPTQLTKITVRKN